MGSIDVLTQAMKTIPKSLLCIPMLLAVFFAFLLPYAASFWSAFSRPGSISVFENSALLNTGLFTLKQAFLSVLVSLALGLPGAWFMGSSPSRSASLLRSFTAIPFAMPSILVVLGFVLFFGNSGWMNRILAAMLGTNEGPLRILYKPQAIILAHGFYNFPVIIRLMGDGLARARRAYAPAAACLGASPFVTAITVILPLAFPSLMSAILLVFLYSFTSFAVVLVLGGGPASTTLSVEIYRHARIFLNYHNAGALALIETLIAVSVFLSYIYFGKKFREDKTDLQNRSTEENRRGLLSWAVMLVYGLVLAIFVFGPLLSITLESLLYRPSRSAGQLLSLRWWASLKDSCLLPLIRSLLLAFSSASLACILAILGAGSLKLLEENNKAKRNTGIFMRPSLIRFFGTAPVVSSGIVLGLGWLILYGRNFSPAALVILHGVIALPFAFNSISEGFRSLPANTLNAAFVSGAGPLRCLLTIALPLSFPRIRSAWGFAAAISLGELNAVMMLGMEEWETLPLFIYRAVGAYRFGTAGAAGSILMLCCAAGFFLSETGRKKHGS